MKKIVNKNILRKFKNNLVIHASNLPKGKGWSALAWQILEGNNNIPVTLFEAEDKVDSGKIYLKSTIKLSGYELIDDLRKLLIKSSYQLCNNFINKYPKILKKGKTQSKNETFYRRRLPEDSQLDLNESIKNQFNLLRITDNKRYPSFFKIDGHKYYLYIKSENDNN